MTQPNQAPALQLGAVIECDFAYPVAHTRTATLCTLAALEYGRQLLADPSSGWRLSNVTVTEKRNLPHDDD